MAGSGFCAISNAGQAAQNGKPDQNRKDQTIPCGGKCDVIVASLVRRDGGTRASRQGLFFYSLAWPGKIGYSGPRKPQICASMAGASHVSQNARSCRNQCRNKGMLSKKYPAIADDKRFFAGVVKNGIYYAK